MSSLRLSHTQLETYKTCGEKYRLHYIERLREDSIGSPLFFGKALDEAINILLLSKQTTLTQKELDNSRKNPFEVFDHFLRNVDLNGTIIDASTSLKVTYLKSDYDELLLTQEDVDAINAAPEEVRANLSNWLSLRRKGHLMIKAYQDKVIPHIKKVISIQKPVKLTNEENDTLIGFIDFIAEWDEEGLVIFDNKTSSRAYGKDAVKESQQLMLYGESEQHYKTGFIVLLKGIKHPKIWGCEQCKKEYKHRRKTCSDCNVEVIEMVDEPYADVEIQIDTLDPKKQEVLFEQIQVTTQSIKDGKFEKNMDSCFSYNRKCPYYDKCRGGEEKGLVKLKVRE